MVHFRFSQDERCRLKNEARLKYVAMSSEDKTKCFIERYRFLQNNRDPDGNEEMHIALSTFLHLQTKLLFKIRYFFRVQVHNLDNPEKEAFMASIRGEFPSHKFNEILMEYFDATMAISEGNVMYATEITRELFEQNERILGLMRPGQYS